jgi:MtN3 and saliva related transmembrane protein
MMEVLTIHKSNGMEIIIGIVAGILTSISMVPQLIKVIKEKDVENLSPVMIGILLLGVSMWVVYGLLQEEWPIILSNAFSVLINSTLLICYFVFRDSK